MRMKFGVILREVGMFNLCLLSTLTILRDKLSSETRWSENQLEESGQQRVSEIKTLPVDSKPSQAARRGLSDRRGFFLVWASCFLLRLQGWAMPYVTVWQIFLYFIFISQILTLTDRLPSVLSGPETSHSTCLLSELFLSSVHHLSVTQPSHFPFLSFLWSISLSLHCCPLLLLFYPVLWWSYL